MADFVFNTGKAIARGYWTNVEGNDPSTSGIRIIPLSQSGSEAQGQDLATVSAVLADANFEEQTTGGWARVNVTDTELSATDFDPNNTDNRGDVSIPQTSLGSPSSGSVTGLLIAYYPDVGGADTTGIPITHHTFAKTGDGSEILVAAGNLLQAT